MNTPIIEGCVDSHTSALAACRGGADRLELCANLAIGGTTPSHALFKQVQRDCAVKINALIRPRFGDFLYSEAELEEIREEIEAFRSLGANGVVIGVLTPEGELDEGRMRRLVDAAGGDGGHAPSGLRHDPRPLRGAGSVGPVGLPDYSDVRSGAKRPGRREGFAGAGPPGGGPDRNHGWLRGAEGEHPGHL